MAAANQIRKEDFKKNGVNDNNHVKKNSNTVKLIHTLKEGFVVRKPTNTPIIKNFCIQWRYYKQINKN